MQKYFLKVVLVMLVSAVFFFAVGYGLHQQASTPLNEVQGTWNGRSKLKTSSGMIHYDINALVQNKNVVLSLVAQTENNEKFTFMLNLEYIEHSGKDMIFAVIDRKTTWLEQIRVKESLDIPVIGHFLKATIVRVNKDEIYLSYSLGGDYSFGTLFEKGI